MDHPFTNKRPRSLSYNLIKRNRVIRSEKNFTENREHTETGETNDKTNFRNQLISLIQAAPKDQRMLANCIQELKEKLQHIKTSPKRKHTPEHPSILARNHTPRKHKHRHKTNQDDQSRKAISKSLHLVPQKVSFGPSLRDLQEVRNQVKRQKQATADKRIPTEKQCFRYMQIEEAYEPYRTRESQQRKTRQHSDIKTRSNTEAVLKSSKFPRRSYHHFSPRKIVLEPNHIKTFQECQDNNLIKASEELPQKDTLDDIRIVDNNEKIGDISTIVRQKETLNFLGDSCVGIKQGLSPPKQRSPDPDTQKLLEFVDWRTNELKNVFSGSKQKKRKTGLDKLSKIFPKGFFL